MLRRPSSVNVIEYVKDVERRARQRLIEKGDKEGQEKDAPPFLLVGKNGYCLAPNALLRTALFGIVRHGRRRFMARWIVPSQGGVVIECDGYQLDQSDFDVWMVLVSMSRGLPLGQEVHFSTYEVLRRLDRTDSGSNHKILHEQLRRLAATHIRVTLGNTVFFGNLIQGGVRHKDTQKYQIVVDSRLRPLFSDAQFTWLQWKVRRALSGKQLALWLHAFYSSHSKPFPYKVETLHRLCGSTASISRFKATLKVALSDIREVSQKFEERFDFAFDGELVCVNRSVSAQSTKRTQMKREEVENKNGSRPPFTVEAGKRPLPSRQVNGAVVTGIGTVARG